jgi:hypothetical protein
VTPEPKDDRGLQGIVPARPSPREKWKTPETAAASGITLIRARDAVPERVQRQSCATGSVQSPSSPTSVPPGRWDLDRLRGIRPLELRRFSSTPRGARTALTRLYALASDSSKNVRAFSGAWSPTPGALPRGARPRRGGACRGRSGGGEVLGCVRKFGEVRHDRFAGLGHGPASRPRCRNPNGRVAGG